MAETRPVELMTATMKDTAPSPLGNGLRLHPIRMLPAGWWIVLALGAAYFTVTSLALPFRIVADGSEYLVMAQNLLTRHSFTYDGVNPVVGKTPGFPFLIALYLKFVGSIHGFRSILLLLMLGFFVFLMAFAKRIVGSNWGIGLFAFLVSLFPLSYLLENLLSEPAFLFLSAAGMIALLKTGETRDRLPPVVAGVAFAAATYFRPITLFWPVGVILLAVLFCRNIWRRFIPVLVVHLILIAPWIYRNWSEFKSVVPMVANWAPLYYMTEGEMWKVYFYEGSGVVRDMPEHLAILEGEFQFNWNPSKRFKDMALENIAENPSEYLKRCVRQSLFAWTYLPGTKDYYRSRSAIFLVGRGVMLLFYALTFFGAVTIWRKDRLVVILLVGYALYTGAMLFPVCTESRYLVPAYLWLLPLTLAGVIMLGKKLRDRVRPS